MCALPTRNLPTARAGLAGGLQSLGVAPGDRVAFLSMNCHRLIEAYYGVLEAGALLLPLNIRLAPHELAFILRDAGVKILFVGKEFVDLAKLCGTMRPPIDKFVLLEGEPAADWLGPKNYDELLAERQAGSGRLHDRWMKILSRSFFTQAGRARIPRA